jgi:hypothetical protein
VKTRKFSALIAGGIVAALAMPALAAQPFDGDWHVSVKSRNKNPGCIATTVALRVDEGNVSYAGMFGGLVSGKVDRAGRLHARMAEVKVSGKLVADSGSGAWKSRNCAGTWQARRR